MTFGAVKDIERKRYHWGLILWMVIRLTQLQSLILQADHEKEIQPQCPLTCSHMTRYLIITSKCNLAFKKNCSITRLYWIIPPESFRGSQLNSVGTTQKDINMRKGRVGSRGFVRGGREIKKNGIGVIRLRYIHLPNCRSTNWFNKNTFLKVAQTQFKT